MASFIIGEKVREIHNANYRDIFDKAVFFGLLKVITMFSICLYQLLGKRANWYVLNSALNFAWPI